MFCKVKNASPTQGFEHVKGYAGSDAGKRGVCSERVCSGCSSCSAYFVDYDQLAEGSPKSLTFMYSSEMRTFLNC